jgi:uncharacterized small protein (DUF1192 family)
MMTRLFRGNQSCVNLFLDEGVILRDLLHVSVANDVDPRVADVADEVVRVGKQQSRRSASHSGFLELFRGALIDGAICELERRGQLLLGFAAREVVDVGEL